LTKARTWYKIGTMKRIGLLSILPLILLLACRSGPHPIEPIPAEPPFAGAAEDDGVQAAEAEAFDPARISADLYESTMAELRAFIEGLNAIIRARNYTAWVSYLSESYYAEINSAEFLARRSEELFRRDQIVASNLGRDPRRVQKRVLRTSRDFFYNVVVPSRSNDRLDDISFVDENRVKAYTVDSRGNRLVLYDLKIIDNRWRIIN